MAQNRRDFLKTSGLLAGAALAGIPNSIYSKPNINFTKVGKMKLTFKPYDLTLKHAFTIATSTRTTTPVMLTEIEYEGVVGYGEASMPPYLGESQASAAEFLGKVNLEQFPDPFDMENILDYVDKIAEKNPAAKASVDIALHDLVGKLMNQPWFKIWGYDKYRSPYTSFTIGIDTPEVVRKKVREADIYKILKVKLGRDNDKQMIETIREITDKPICVDANQGWTDRVKALDMAYWLKEKGITFIEQAMPKENIDGNAWLTENSPLPTFGDESVQRLPDVIKAHKVYSGINIKLMKSTGMREAHKMLTLARGLGMKVMLGCMTETSCAISAASHLSPMVDFADLDGAVLISNDCFNGTTIEDGKISLTDRPGIGAIKK